LLLNVPRIDLRKPVLYHPRLLKLIILFIELFYPENENAVWNLNVLTYKTFYIRTSILFTD